MKLIITFFLILFLSFYNYAQTNLDDASSITIAELRDHMYYLASDELEGRKPGTSGYEKATEYAISQFRQAGIIPLINNSDGELSFKQTVNFEKYKWEDTNTIVIENKQGKTTYCTSENFFISNGEPYSQTKLEGELVFVGAGICEPDYGIDNFKDIDVKGKWIISYFNVPDTLKKILPPDVYSRYTDKKTGKGLRSKIAAEAGAIGTIFIPSEGQRAVWHAYAGGNKEKVFIKEVTTSVGNKQNTSVVADSIVLSNLFQGQNFNPIRDNVNLSSFSLGNTRLKLTKDVGKSEFQSQNIIGMIEGNDPQLKKEFITLGAHLDHIGVSNNGVNNGANDNASGSIGVIEIAEAVALSKPKYSVLFILYTAEEMSLLGSKYLVRNPPVPLEKVKVNINLEMLGRSDGDVEYQIAPLISEPVNLALKESIVKTHNKYPLTGLDWPFAESFPYKNSTDHFSFHNKGIPAVTFITNVFPDDFHTPHDDAHKIDYEYLQKNCQFVYHLVMDLANSEKLELSQKTD